MLILSKLMHISGYTWIIFAIIFVLQWVAKSEARTRVEERFFSGFH